jgi:protocatechuate 3,4-dioxygenase beta subunit
MRNFLKIALPLALLTMLAACASLPPPTTPAPITSAPGEVAAPVMPVLPAPTEAPAALEAPDSTDTPGSADGAPTPAAGASSATEMPPRQADESRPTAAVDAAVTQPPTEPPLPTMPPAAMEATPSIACAPGALTPGQMEGPYYKANPPETSSLLQPGMEGRRIFLTGHVLDEQCRPIPGARVDFWQADAAGQYDNQGFTLRGYQLTDDTGRYAMETVVPGEYPGRTPHIHVKVTPPGGPTLTSQLYLPDSAANETDRIFDRELIVTLTEGPDGPIGRFNFIVRTR